MKLTQLLLAACALFSGAKAAPVGPTKVIHLNGKDFGLPSNMSHVTHVPCGTHMDIIPPILPGLEKRRRPEMITADANPTAVAVGSPDEPASVADNTPVPTNAATPSAIEASWKVPIIDGAGKPIKGVELTVSRPADGPPEVHLLDPAKILAANRTSAATDISAATNASATTDCSSATKSSAATNSSAPAPSGVDAWQAEWDQYWTERAAEAEAYENAHARSHMPKWMQKLASMMSNDKTKKRDADDDGGDAPVKRSNSLEWHPERWHPEFAE